MHLVNKNLQKKSVYYNKKEFEIFKISLFTVT